MAGSRRILVGCCCTFALAFAGVALGPAAAQASFTWVTSAAADQALTDPTTAAVDGNEVLCPTRKDCVGFGDALTPGSITNDTLSTSVFAPAALASATHADVIQYPEIYPQFNLPTDFACSNIFRCLVVQMDGQITTFDPSTGANELAFQIPGDASGAVVACPGWFRCVALSRITNEIATFDPWVATSLVIKPFGLIPAGDGFWNLVCPTVSQCTVLIGDGLSSSTTEVTFDPSTQVAVSHAQIVPPGASSAANFVVCPSASQCTAAVFGGELTFDPLTGTLIARARTTTDPITPQIPGVVRPIACTSTTDCVEASSTGVMYEGNPRARIAWTPENITGPLPSSGFQPQSVTCPTSIECVVTGLGGMAIGAAANSSG